MGTYYIDHEMKPNYIKIHGNRSKKGSLAGLTHEIRDKLQYASREEIEKYNKKFPDSENCVAICGLNKQGYSLVVFDFDRKVSSTKNMTPNSKEQIEFNKYVAEIIAECFLWDPKQVPLYIVHSGGLGFHIYFYVDSRNLGYEIRGEKLRNLKNECLENNLQGIDILAEKNLVFGPGCDFRNFQEDEKSWHAIRYTLQEDVDVPVISIDTFNQFVYSIKKYVLRTEIPIPESDEPIRIAFINEEYDELIDRLNCREAFKMILRGDIPVENSAFEHLEREVKSDTVKFKIWSAFWKEMINDVQYNNELREKILKILEVSQSEFNKLETLANLRRMEREKDKNKKITNPTYRRYFNPWTQLIERIDAENRENETIILSSDNELGITEEINKINWVNILGSKLIEKFYCFYLTDKKEYGYYNGKCYVIDTQYVKRLIFDGLMVIQRIPSVNNVNVVLTFISSTNYYKELDFDTDSDLWVFQNCIYNIATQEMTPHTPNVLSLRLSKYSYLPDQNTIPEDTQDFLNSLGYSDDEKKRLVYITKAFIEGDMSVNKYFAVFWGVPDSGKSKYAEKIGRMIGDIGRDYRLLRLEKTGGTFGLQGLSGTRYIVIDDVGVKALNAQTFSVFKTMTSGGYCEFEEKFKDSSQFYIKFGVCLTCNQLMQLPVYEEINALVSRCFVFRFIISHSKTGEFVNKFIDNPDDSEKYLSYLLNLPRKQLNEIEQLPDFERNNYKDCKQYWLNNANPIHMLCSQYIRKCDGMKVELNSLQNMLQQIANDTGLNIDFGNRYTTEQLKSYCRKEFNASTPPSKFNENREYLTWICGIDADNVRKEPIIDPTEMSSDRVDSIINPEPFVLELESPQRITQRKRKESEELSKLDADSFEIQVYEYLMAAKQLMSVEDLVEALKDFGGDVRLAIIELEMRDMVRRDRNGSYYPVRGKNRDMKEVKS